jgi:hypothetical protein
MDGLQFDSLTRLVGAVSTRRFALRATLGGAAAAVGLAAMAGESAAKKKKRKKCKKCKPLDADASCTTNKQCCTNETNRACAVPENASSSDKTCCGALNGECGGFDGMSTIAPFCCADYVCSSLTETPGTCQPVPIV